MVLKLNFVWPVIHLAFLKLVIISDIPLTLNVLDTETPPSTLLNPSRPNVAQNNKFVGLVRDRSLGCVVLRKNLCGCPVTVCVVTFQHTVVFCTETKP